MLIIQREAAKPYNRALKDNAHARELKFMTIPTQRDRTSYDPIVFTTTNLRKRNVIGSILLSVKMLLPIPEKSFFYPFCFTPNNKPQKIINKNRVKLSYSNKLSTRTG